MDHWQEEGWAAGECRSVSERAPTGSHLSAKHGPERRSRVHGRQKPVIPNEESKMRSLTIGMLSAAATIFVTGGPIRAQQGDEIVIKIVKLKLEKDRFAFASANGKPGLPIDVRVGQLVTWTNQTGTAFALVSDQKGSDGKPLFDVKIPKKGNVSLTFTEKMFKDAGGRPGGTVKVDYICTNPNTRGVIELNRPITQFDKHIENGLKLGKERKWSDGFDALENAEKFAQKEKNAPAQGHAALHLALHIKGWVASPEVTDADKAKLKQREIDAYKSATQNLPPDTRDYELARNNLGKIYLDNGKYTEALAEFGEIKQPSSNNAHVLYTNIGQAHEGNKDLNNAYKYYLMAIGQRSSAEVAARKAFSLLTREDGLPAQRSKELFDMVLRPGS